MIYVTKFENWHIVGIRNGVDGKFSVLWQPKFVGSIRILDRIMFARLVD